MSHYIFPKARDSRTLSAKSRVAVAADIASGKYIPSIKLDGCALVIQFTHNNAVALSGDGHIVRSADHIIADLRSCYCYTVLAGTTFVGEAWSPGKEFAELSGEFRRHQRGAYEFHVYDVLPNMTPNIGYEHRIATVAAYHRKPTYVRRVTVPPVPRNTLSEMFAADGEGMHVGHGADGIVLHHRGATWSAGRSATAVVKIKPKVSLDLKVVAVEVGKGRNANRIGALVCEGSFGKVSVGTGLSDADRERDDWVGKVVEVHCMGLHAASGIPREPRLHRRREDKTGDQTD